MVLSSYVWLLIACCFCSVASCFKEQQNLDEFPIGMRSFVRSSQNRPSSVFKQEEEEVEEVEEEEEVEEDMECSKKCFNWLQPNKRSANTQNSPIIFSHENPMEVRMEAPNMIPKKLRRFRKKNKNGKRRRKFKGGKKKAAPIPPVIPSLFTEDLRMGVPANNPAMSVPSKESSILVLPEKEGGFINLTDPTKEQFQVETKNDFGGFIANGLHALEQSLNDNFGIQVPSKVIVKNKKVGFIEGIAEKGSIENGQKQLKQGASVSTEQPKEAEKPKGEIEIEKGKENKELTTQILNLLNDINANAENPENFTESLKEIKNDLIILMPKQKDTQS